MARRRNPPVPNATRRLAAVAANAWADPEATDEDESLDPVAQTTNREADEEAGEGVERVASGTGLRKEPVTVELDDVQLAALAAEFAEEIETQYAEQAPLRKDIERYLKVYRAKPLWDRKDYPIQSASNVTVALAAIYVDQVDARLMQSIFQPEPHWLVRELNRKLAPACKPYERYLDWIRENLWDQKEVVFDFVQDLTRLGTGIIYNDYVRESVRRYDDVRKTTVEEAVRIGPRPRWVPREDFLVPIGYDNLQKAPYCAHRNWFSWGDLEKMSYDGTIRQECLEVLKDNPDSEDEVRMERRKNRDQMVSADASNTFGVWCPWYVWFRRDLDRDGYPEEYVMLLHIETKQILRLVANPSPSGTRPYVHARFVKVNGEFDGIGIPEQVEQLQDETSTIHNQRRDRAHLAMTVMWKKRATSQSVPETVRPESGKVITVTDMNDLMPLELSNPVQIEAFEEDFVRRLAADRVGQSDLDMNRISSPVGRAAATTIMALMQEGSRRFDLNVSMVRSALTEQGHQLTELFQIYGLPGPDDVGSPEQLLDEKDAAIVRELLSNQQSLRGFVAIQLNVATAAVNREVEKQSNMQLYGLVQGYMNSVAGQIAPIIMNAQTPPPLKELLLHGVKGLDKILEKIFQSHNAFDLDSVLAGEILEQMAAQVQQNPQMGIQGPVGAPQGGEQPQEQQAPAAPQAQVRPQQ